MTMPKLPDRGRIRKWPRNIWRFIGDQWWTILSTLLVLSLIGMLLGVQLMGLTSHHLSAAEQVYQTHLVTNNLSLQAILRNPVNLPFSLGLYLFEKLHLSDPLALRGLSAFFGALAILSFYLILKSWHTRRIAILGTVLFATSAWTLHISRLGIPEVLLMLPMVLILCAIWLEASAKRRLTLILCLVAALLLIYIPGMAVFVLAGIIWQSKHIYHELRQTSLWFVIPWALLGLLLLAPLIWAVLTAPHNLMALMGIPAKLPTAKQYAINLGKVPFNLAVRGPQDPMRWLGRLPLLDLFTGIMTAIGIYAYAFRFRLDRTKLLAGIFVVGSLLIALNGGVTISFLMPFVYILAAGGMTLMLQQWRTVFPRNPLARSVATTLMTLVVLLAAFYNINHYFIAWPNAPETRQVFTLN